LNFRKNFGVVSRGIKRRFTGVFEGGFGKSGVQRWCFCGEVVVDCVVKRGAPDGCFRALKTCQLFRNIFERQASIKTADCRNRTQDLRRMRSRIVKRLSHAKRAGAG
jgi:hypothetical protein